MRNITKRKAIAVGGALAVFASLYLGGVRPWHRTWGATHDEQRATLPGDELVADARAEATTTHAITIEAPVEDVWPWLAQLGQDRGGFYSYELLEDIVGCEMENATELLPDRQHWALGDKLWMMPPDKLDGMGHAVLAAFVPGRALAFATHQLGTPPDGPYDGTWSMVLEPISASSTRLLIRGRAGGERSIGGMLFDVLAFEPMHFVMERKMMENMKRLAEQKDTSPVRDSLEAVLFAAAALSALFALVRTFRAQAWQRPFAGFVLSVLAFHVQTFLQPGPEVGIALLLGIQLGVWFGGRPRSGRYVPHPPPPALASDSLR